MKIKYLSAAGISLLVFFNVGGNFAYAVNEAGEIQRKEQKSPHATMEVAHNITNIKFAEDENIEGDGAINFSADELTNDESSGLITALFRPPAAYG